MMHSMNSIYLPSNDSLCIMVPSRCFISLFGLYIKMESAYKMNNVQRTSFYHYIKVEFTVQGQNYSKLHPQFKCLFTNRKQFKVALKHSF